MSGPGLYSKREPQMIREVPRGMRIAMLPESHVAMVWRVVAEVHRSGPGAR